MKRANANHIMAGMAVVALLVSLCTPIMVSAGNKVKICHATGSDGKYTYNIVSENAIGGHFENPGSPLEGHEEDILLTNPNDLCPGEPEPTPEPSESPSPTPEPSESPSPSPTPTDSPEPTPEPSESPSPTPEPSESPSPSPTPTDSPEPTPEPSESPSPTPEPSESPSPSPTPTDSPEPTPEPKRSGGGGGSYIQPTPTPAPGIGGGVPNDLPEILGASTELPETGIAGTGHLLMALWASMFGTGAFMTRNGIRKLRSLK